MPKGQPIPPHVLQDILERFDAHRKRGCGVMEAYEKVGLEVGRSTKVVGVLINRMRPTVGAARLYLRSRALRLAKRLVAKAGPAEIMTLLERPSMGVIDPPTKQESGGGGFFLAVEASSCGAVKVGIAQGQVEAPPAPVEAFDPFALQAGETHGLQVSEESPVRRFLGRSKATQIAIERARIRLENARQQQSGGGPGGRAEDGGLQVGDEQPAEAEVIDI